LFNRQLAESILSYTSEVVQKFQMEVDKVGEREE
jgi:hypothetical protein